MFSPLTRAADLSEDVESGGHSASFWGLTAGLQTQPDNHKQFVQLQQENCLSSINMLY